MPKFFRAIPCLLGLLIQGCAHRPMEVQSDFDRSFDFVHARSFDFTGGTMETDAAQKTRERLQLDALVAQEIQSELEARGLMKSEHSPDLQVSYAFGEWALDTHQKPNGGYGAVGIMFPGAHGSLLPSESDGRVPPPSKDPYTSKYEEAKLEVLMIDPRSKKVVFNASVTDKSDFGYFRPEQRERIQAATKEILKGFPPETVIHRATPQAGP